MALVLPDFEKYQPDLVVQAPIGRHKTGIEIFRGRGNHRQSSGEVIGLLHGWLGQFTVRYIAAALADHGHDVFTFPNVQRTGKGQSANVHIATKTAVEYLGNPQVRYIGHSRAVKPIVDSAKFQKGRDSSDLTYVISRVTTVDGLGTNGQNINFVELRRELKSLGEQAIRSPHRSANVVGQSVLNFLVSPVSSTVEGIKCLGYDATADLTAIADAGVKVQSAFHDEDFVIKAPEQLEPNMKIFPGAHLTAVIDPETMINLAAS